VSSRSLTFGISIIENINLNQALITLRLKRVKKTSTLIPNNPVSTLSQN